MKRHWPLDLTSGALVASSGTLLVQTLSAKYINNIPSGEDVIGTLRDTERSLGAELTCVLKPGQGLWLPFGATAIVTGVSSSRETVKVVEDEEGKKGKKSPAKKKADDREFVYFLFYPCFSSHDAQATQKSVLAVTSSLTACSPHFPKMVVGNEKFLNWRDQLTVSAKTVKEKVEKPEKVEKRRQEEEAAKQQAEKAAAEITAPIAAAEDLQ